MYSQKHSSPPSSSKQCKALKIHFHPHYFKRAYCSIMGVVVYTKYRGRVGSFIKKEESCKIQQFTSFSTAIK